MGSDQGFAAGTRGACAGSECTALAQSTNSSSFNDIGIAPRKNSDNANDPAGFLEKLQVVSADDTPITPWITDISTILTNGTLSGNSNTQQILNLSLGIVSGDPLFLKMLFQSQSPFNGTNTAEYLIATVTGPDEPPQGKPRCLCLRLLSCLSQASSAWPP